MVKTVIITGGNSGLGYHCAQTISQNSDWHIVLACRNQAKADQAVQKLQLESNSQQIEAMILDLASFASVRSFVTKFISLDLPPLQAIVANAGVQFIQKQTYTSDGFDTTFGVNHLGHFLLVNLLLKHLNSPARVVFVSSDTHDSSKTTGMPAPYFREPELMAHPEQDPFLTNKNIGEIGRIAYTTSKLCNVLCAYELNRRLVAKSDPNFAAITVNVFNPGLMPGSGLASDYNAIAKFVWNNILPILCNFIPKVNTMPDAGSGLARLVTDPELANVTAKYFSCLEMTNSATESYDQSKAEQLWQGSVELTGLQANETIV